MLFNLKTNSSLLSKLSSFWYIPTFYQSNASFNVSKIMHFSVKEEDLNDPCLSFKMLVGKIFWKIFFVEMYTSKPGWGLKSVQVRVGS